MDSATLLNKVLELEKELLELKSQFPAGSKLKRFFKRCRSALDGLLAYWVPLALIVGLVVNWWFGVGFFENIKNIGINKTSSDYYYDIGDKLMSHAEFPAAADSFKKALEINSYNINATRGLMKAQVMQAEGGSQTFNPIVVEDKLNNLRKIFGDDDYILLYWEGILRRQLSSTPKDLQLPESLFLKSIQKNPRFPGSHLELGNTYLLGGEIDKAIKKFEEVVQIDPRFASALSNLGYCRFVLSNFEADEKSRQTVLGDAAKQLSDARSSMPAAETDLRLGDTYLFMGQFRAAKISYQNALETLERTGDQKGLVPSEVLFVFLPAGSTVESHDREPAVKVGTNNQLKSLIFFSLSIDDAAGGEFTDAQKHFKEARALDVRNEFSPLVAHQINSLLRIPTITKSSHDWLLAHMNEVCAKDEACLPETINSSQVERKQK